MLIVQIIVVVLFVLGVRRYCERADQLRRLKPDQFPNCPEEIFNQWRQWWLLSERIYLFIAGPVFLAWLLSLGAERYLPVLGIIQGLALIFWFLALFPAAFFGTKAALLNKKYGFRKAMQRGQTSSNP